MDELPALRFNEDVISELGSTLSESFQQFSNRWHFGYDPITTDISELIPSICHTPASVHTRRNPVCYTVLIDSHFPYLLCEKAFKDVLDKNGIVSLYREWVGNNSNSKGKWKMKAPMPKMADFGNIETWEELCGGIDKPVKAVITAEPTEGKYGWQLPLDIKGKPLIQTVKDDSRNYKTLFDKLGSDFADWVNKSVKVSVFVMKDGEFKGNKALRISA